MRYNGIGGNLGGGKKCRNENFISRVGIVSLQEAVLLK